MNAAGTFYYSNWDAGGTDQILYERERDSLIDLRAATLQYEQGGGGRVSYADGIFGDSTIANGAIIEDARSGPGDDTLIGNAAANTLTAGAGNDLLRGGLGVDTLLGGLGDDWIEGGAGADVMTGGTGGDVFAFARDLAAGKDRVTDFGADDVIVSTVAFKDGNKDDLITYSKNKSFDFT